MFDSVIHVGDIIGYVIVDVIMYFIHTYERGCKVL